MKMILWKELREGAKTIPAAMFVAWIIAYHNAPTPGTSQSLFFSNSLFYAMLVGGLYAFILSLLQTWNEQRTDVRGWLFSQPTTRRSVFWGKFAAAVLLYVAAFTPVYLLCIGWMVQNFPGNGPIDPRSMMRPGIGLISAFAFYPAGVWMMSRSASWFGSKTLPIAMGFLVAGLTTAILSSPADDWLLIPVVIAVAMMFLVVTAARFSYQRMTNAPSRWLDGRPGVSNRGEKFAGRLSAAAVMFVTVSIYFFAIATFSSHLADAFRPRFAQSDAQVVTDQGDLVKVTYVIEYDPEQGNRIRIRDAVRQLPITPDSSATQQSIKLTDELRAELSESMNASVGLGVFTGDPSPTRLFQHFVLNGISIPGTKLQWFQRNDGVLIGYRAYNWNSPSETLLATTMDRSGFGRTSAPFSKGEVAVTQVLMSSPVSLPVRLQGRAYLNDRHGIYEVNTVDNEIRTVLEMTLSGAVLVQHFGDSGWTMVVQRDNEVQLFDVSGANGQELPTRPEGLPDRFTAELPWPSIQLTHRETLRLPPQWGNWSQARRGNEVIHSSDSGRVFLTSQRYQEGTHLVELSGNSDFGSSDSGNREAANVPEMKVYPGEPKAEMSLAEVSGLAFAPPLFVAIVFSIDLFQQQISWLWIICLSLAMFQLATAFIWTRWMAKRRALSHRHIRIWAMLSLLFGWCVPIVIATLHHKIAQEPCSECGEPSRADQDSCPTCGNAKDTPHGNEVLLCIDAAT